MQYNNHGSIVHPPTPRLVPPYYFYYLIFGFATLMQQLPRKPSHGLQTANQNHSDVKLILKSKSYAIKSYFFTCDVPQGSFCHMLSTKSKFPNRFSKPLSPVCTKSQIYIS